MSLGSRLRTWIEVHGMTVRGFEKKSGIPYRSIHEYLSDKRKPSATHLEKMVGTGVDISWLLTGIYKPNAIELDMSAYDKLVAETYTVVAVDKDMSHYFFSEAIGLVDQWSLEHPEETRGMGVFGLIASIVSVWGCYAHAADAISDNIFSSRSKGATVEEVGGPIVTTLRPFLKDRLKVIAPVKSPPSG